MINQIKFYMGSFFNGELEATPLPTTQNCKLNLDITNSESMDVEVALETLPESATSDFNTYFGLSKKIVVAVNDNLAWDEPGKILFGGFVNKISQNVGKTLVTLAVASLNEYSASVYAAPWRKITNPKETFEYSGATWQQVQARIAEALFRQVGVPANAAKIPNVLGTVPAITGDAVKKSVLVGGMNKYLEIMEQVRDEDSSSGNEWQYRARFTDSTMTAVVWDLIVGTESVPQINFDNVINITLEDESKIKPSAASTMSDSTNFYTRLWTQSKNGEGTAGMDLEPFFKPGSQSNILYDSYQSFNAELTEAEMAAQVASRIPEAGETGRTFTLTTEEADFSLWQTRLGSKIVISGQSAITSGHAGTFRLLAIDFNAGKDSLTLTVAQPQRVYPKLPKNRIKNIGGGRAAGSNLNSQPKLSVYQPGSGGGGGGSGPLPPQPWEPGNPADPSDGGAGASWGMNAGGNIGDDPILNNLVPVATLHQSGTTLWGGLNVNNSSEGAVLSESNILHVLKSFGPLSTKLYTWAESPIRPIGLGLGQTAPSVVYSCFLQEGEVRGSKVIFEGDIFTDLNIEASFTLAGTASLWARPPAVEIPSSGSSPGNVSEFSVKSVAIGSSTKQAISSGGRIIVPIQFIIVWGRDNATSNGNPPTNWGQVSADITNTYTVFLKADYEGLDTIDSNWEFIPQFGQSGLLQSMGRIGSFGLFHNNGGRALRSVNFGGAQGLDSNQWIFPPIPSGNVINGFHFGQYTGNAYRVYCWDGAGNMFSIPVAGGTAPVPAEDNWESLGVVTPVALSGGGQSSTCFNAKPIFFRRGPSSTFVLSSISGPEPQVNNITTGNLGSSWSGIFCYRNYLYMFGNSGTYSSYTMNYVP